MVTNGQMPSRSAKAQSKEMASQKSLVSAQVSSGLHGEAAREEPVNVRINGEWACGVVDPGSQMAWVEALGEHPQERGSRPAHHLAKEDLKLALEAAMLYCRTNDYPMIMAAWRAALASLEKGEEIIISDSK